MNRLNRISALLFLVLSAFSVTFAQTPFQLDSLQYVEELEAHRIPTLIEVRAEGETVLYAEPCDTAFSVNKIIGIPLFLLSESGDYWACSYFGYLAYVKKESAVNSDAIGTAYEGLSQHYRYLLAYNAEVQALQIALEYAQQTQKAVQDNTIEDEPLLLQYYDSEHRQFQDAVPYVMALDPKVFFSK